MAGNYPGLDAHTKDKEQNNVASVFVVSSTCWQSKGVTVNKNLERRGACLPLQSHVYNKKLVFQNY